MALEDKNFFTSLSQYVVLVLSAAGNVFILGWLFKYSRYGIDFTDESFYLVWISNPFLYNISTSQFGFIYHPLYILFGGDIAGLRQANIVITFGLGWCLACCFLTSLAPDARGKRIVLHTASAGLATSSLILFDNWLSTPSYNSLAFQGLLVTGIGVLLVDKAVTRRSIVGWMLLAIGGWLVFMAKPSTAIALGTGVFLCLIVSRKLSLRLLFFAIVATLALLLISAISIDGSVAAFVKRIQLGIEFAGYLGGGHTVDQILRIDDFRLRTRGKLAILFVLLPTLAAAWGCLTKNPRGPVVTLTVCVAFFALVAALSLSQIDAVIGLGEFQGLLIFGVMAAAVLTGLILGRTDAVKGISLSQWSVASLFLAMPHIFAFGTNRNYWINGSWAGLFWLLACITVLGPIARRHLTWSFALPFAISAQVVTALLLQTGIQQPQRQPQPLKRNDTTLEIGTERSELTLSPSYASYLAAAITTAESKGFTSGTAVIDLSGQSPGVLYAIGAKSIGQAWMIGGYPGSPTLAEAALNHVSCEDIVKAWVLFEPNGPRSIPTGIMLGLGTSFPESYHKVGSWQTPKGAGGYDEIRTQELYEPTKPEDAMETCQALRRGKKT